MIRRRKTNDKIEMARRNDVAKHLTYDCLSLKYPWILAVSERPTVAHAFRIHHHFLKTLAVQPDIFRRAIFMLHYLWPWHMCPYPNFRYQICVNSVLRGTQTSCAMRQSLSLLLIKSLKGPLSSIFDRVGMDHLVVFKLHINPKSLSLVTQPA